MMKDKGVEKGCCAAKISLKKSIFVKENINHIDNALKKQEKFMFIITVVVIAVFKESIAVTLKRVYLYLNKDGC